MTDRILDLAQQPVALSSRGGLLVVRDTDHNELDTIPFSDIAAVVASHRQITVTQAALSSLAEAGAAFISCNDKMMPAAMLLPLEGHYSQTARFLQQAALAAPRRKRYWQAIVQGKIRSQGMVLETLHGNDAGLKAMSTRVRSGDEGNLESQASRRYWLWIFQDPAFRRGNEEDPRNALLNYGYAILRAATARALCAAGLHPSFGLHHSNKLNPFVLADDVMEPFRPCVDYVVSELGTAALMPETKRQLIASITGRYLVDSEERTLFDILSRTAQSLAAAIQANATAWRPLSWSFSAEASIPRKPADRQRSSDCAMSRTSS